MAVDNLPMRLRLEVDVYSGVYHIWQENSKCPHVARVNCECNPELFLIGLYPVYIHCEGNWLACSRYELEKCLLY